MVDIKIIAAVNIVFVLSLAMLFSCCEIYVYFRIIIYLIFYNIK
jgi:hypothetical protein